MLACLPCTYNSTMSHVDKTFSRVSVVRFWCVRFALQALPLNESKFFSRGP
jgi:hypothetical protein